MCEEEEMEWGGEGGNSMGLILDARSQPFFLETKSVYLHSLSLGPCLPE